MFFLDVSQVRILALEDDSVAKLTCVLDTMDLHLMSEPCVDVAKVGHIASGEGADIGT